MKYRVVLTCNAKAWEHHGARNVERFLEMWAPSIPITVYTEGFSMKKSSRVSTMDLLGSSSWLRGFLDCFNNHPVVKTRNQDARWRANTWSYAVAATAHALQHASKDVDVIIRLDADVITHAPIDEAWLDSLWGPGDPAIAWLYRSWSSGLDYPEMGFGMFKAHHPRMAKVVTEWIRQYASASIFNGQGWTDAHTLQNALVHAASFHAHELVCSLSGDAEHHAHPFVNGPLGEKMDHLKGPRKELGKSRASDFFRPRSEAYWQ